MRTISTALDYILTSNARADHLKVEVDSTGSGDFIEITNYWQKDWVLSCSVSENEDDPCATAKLTVMRSFEDIHMSPLVVNSPVNATSDLLYINREIKIYFATTGADTPPASGDWALKFHGYIDDIDMGGTNIKISCRDQGSKVIDTFIQTIAKYGTAGGQAVETAMQAIVTANVASPPTIYVPSSPSWNILEYWQTKEPVMTALQKLADQIGWIIKYRWDSGTSAYRLTFYAPDRTVSSTVRNFGPSEYWEIGKASISLKSVRTKVAVYFYENPEDEIDVRTATSVAGILAKYGTRYMEITESASSNIDSGTEAQTMANNILADLEDPSLEHSVTMPLFWPAETGDYYGFTDNSVIYDSTQSLAVFAITHNFANGKASTSMELRGKPASAARRWLSLEGRPGIAKPVVNKTDAAATGITTTPSPSTVVVEYPHPLEMSPPVRNWATTRCYMSTSSGFTPGPSNLVADARTTRFEVSGLEPGTVYYTVIEIVDDAGNVSAASAESSETSSYVGPYHETPENDYTNMAPGATFGVWSPPADKTTDPPDRWKTQRDTGGGYADYDLWESGKIYYIASGNQGYGAYGVRITQAQSGYPRAIASTELIPVEYKKTYSVGITYYGQETGGGSVTGMDSNLVVTYYEDDKTTVAGTDTFVLPNSSVGTGVIWRVLEYSDAPVDSAYASIRIEVDSTVASDSVWMDIYSFSFTETKTSFRAESAGTKSAASATWELVPFDEDFSHGSGFFDYVSGPPESGSFYTIPKGDVYQFNAQALVQSLPDGEYFQLGISFDGGSTVSIFSPRFYNHTGVARTVYATIDTGRLTHNWSATAANNQVSVWAYQSDSSSKTIDGIFFSGGAI